MENGLRKQPTAIQIGGRKKDSNQSDRKRNGDGISEISIYSPEKVAIWTKKKRIEIRTGREEKMTIQYGEKLSKSMFSFEF